MSPAATAHMTTAVARSGYPAMLELTGLTSEAAPVVKVMSASPAAAMSAARGPRRRWTTQATMTRHEPVMRIDTSGMPMAAPNARIGAASR